MIDDLSLLILGILGAIAFAVAGGMMLSRAHRSVTGAVLGFFLGPLGLVIAWIMRDNALRDETTVMHSHAAAIDDVMARLRETDPNRQHR